MMIGNLLAENGWLFRKSCRFQLSSVLYAATWLTTECRIISSFCVWPFAGGSTLNSLINLGGVKRKSISVLLKGG